MDKLFYELVQVSIGQRPSLSHSPTQEEWKRLHAAAGKQSLRGVCFAGVKRLAELGISPDRPLYLKWMGEAAILQKRNEVLSERCSQIRAELQKEGFDMCILKGQGVAKYYGELSCYRQCGDIDLWADAPMEKVMEYVAPRHPSLDFNWIHANLGKIDDVEVELHWLPSDAVNPLQRKAMAHYFREQAPVQCKRFAPSADFQLVHVLQHTLVHFLYEGVGLRQLMDLYFILLGSTPGERSEAWMVIKKFRLAGFAAATMWVMEEVFGMNPDDALCQSDPKLGRKLLREIERGGDFGHHNKRSAKRGERFGSRMVKRFSRKLNLVQYNPLGVVCGPFTKVKFLCFRRRVIRKYNLAG